MTIKSVSLALALVVGFGASAVKAEETITTTTTNAVGTAIKTIIDPGKWHDDSGNVESGIMVGFNPADPKSWLNFVDPKMHTKMHMSFTNPAQYGQFFRPKFHVDMMKPSVWMAWMNPKTYAVLVDPSTYTYWMQPGAYKHVLDLTHYSQIINMDAYGKLYDEVATGAGELIDTNGEYSLTNTDNLINIANPMTYAQAMIEGAKKIIE